MKLILQLLLLLATDEAVEAQNFVLPYGEYMDTTVVSNAKCDDKYLIYYYHVDTKYPMSTATMMRDSKLFLSQKAKRYTGSGYITFRFRIDCEGKMQRVRVMQTDEEYQTIHFDKSLIAELNDFIHTLDRWEKGLSAYELKNVNYIALLTFKIKNGEIVNVIY